MTQRPTGTVTFFFTDVEGSTRLWEERRTDMRLALRRHEELVRAAIQDAGGHVFKTVGDAFCAAFDRADHALAAALATQLALLHEPWREGVEIRVRCALHTGTADERDGDYFGPTLNRTARLLALGHGGQVLLSRATAELARQALPEGARLRGLGSHRLKDIDRLEEVFQLVHVDLPADFPGLRSSANGARELPRQLTSFLGRESELEVASALLSEARLLALTGLGGTGKTRLALELARTWSGEASDGPWFVDLTPLDESARVVAAVAEVLGVRAPARGELEGELAERLSDAEALLVLDNCEHVVDGCRALVERLLRECPRLRIVATSRIALGVEGEVEYVVPPLTTPPSADALSWTALENFDAVRLFVARARSASPGFELGPGNAHAIARVCARVAGIPLAIELAAARARALGVDEIAQRLERSFGLLAGRKSSADGRRRTLWATFDWSYGQAREEERVLLRRLSVFVGGWTLAAAEATSDDPDVLEHVSALVDQSFVLRVDAPPTSARPPAASRYRFLEPVRQYAAEKLAGAGEEAAARDRHLEHFLHVATVAEMHVSGAGSAEPLARIEADHDNFVAALGWAASGYHDPQAGLRLAEALWRFWYLRGHVRLGLERVRAALARAGSGAREDIVLQPASATGGGEKAQTAARASCLHAEGVFLWVGGELTAARASIEQGLSIRRALDDERGVAMSLNGLGILSMDEGDHDAARGLHEESLRIRRAIGDRFGIAMSLHNLALVAFAREPPDLDGAEALWQEAVAQSQANGNDAGVASAKHQLARIALSRGERGPAAALAGQSLELKVSLEDRMGLTDSLVLAAALALHDGRHALAAMLLESTMKLRDDLGVTPEPRERAELDELVGAARAALEREAYAAAAARGRALDWGAAIPEARSAIAGT